MRSVIFALLLAMPAAADEAGDRARKLFEEGQKALAGGRAAEALRAFEDANAAVPSPVLDYYAGLALEALGRRDDAVARYRAYLERDPYAGNRMEVEERIRRLQSPDAAAVAPLPPPGAVPPPGGPPAPQAPGMPALAAPVAAPPPAMAPTVQAPPTPPLPSPLPEEPPAPRHRYPSGGSLVTKWWFWAAVAGVVGAAVVAGVAVAATEDGSAAPAGTR